MSHTMHSLALVAAAIGVCSAAIDHGRGRARMTGAAALMLFAMADSARPAPVLPAAAWMALLILAAITFAAIERVQLQVRGATRPVDLSPLQVHSAFGLVVMAALLAPGAAGEIPGTSTNHVHGLAEASLTTVLVCLGAAYAVVSVVVAARSHSALSSIHLSTMGASAGLMALGIAL